jgi:2-aminoethylphosphonate dioxygenase
MGNPPVREAQLRWMPLGKPAPTIRRSRLGKVLDFLWQPASEDLRFRRRNISEMKLHPFRISKGQVDYFRKCGYIYLPHFFPPDLVCVLREISDKMSSQAFAILESSRAAGVPLSDRAKTGQIELLVVPEKSSPTLVCRYEFMIGSDSKFKEFVRNCLERAVSELVGESVLPFKDKTNEKLPGGGAFGPHQDFAAYQAFKPRYHATALLTIDSANIANGCVQVATNVDELIMAKPTFVLDTIKDKALLHYNHGGPHHGDITADITSELLWHPLQTNPVDLVVFDSFVPHYSRANTSTKPRRAIFVTFNRASEGSLYDDYYADKRLNYDDPKFHISTPTSHRGIAGVSFD